MPNVITKSYAGTIITLQTIGLAASGHQEISASVETSLEKEAEEYLLFVYEYIKGGARLQAQETMAYGFWLTKFCQSKQKGLEVWEYNREATGFVPGINRTLLYWKNQHEVCAAKGAIFDPPRPDKLSVVSAGVLEGLPVQGVRYASPEYMSGWWITSDLYDGNINTLVNEHTYHVTAARPDLAKYLALPDGYRFDLSNGEDVWFDETISTPLNN